jgi:hypothetical protein
VSGNPSQNSPRRLTLTNPRRDSLMDVATERLPVRQAAAELGIDGADLYRMIFTGEVAGRPDFDDAKVYITRDELERVRATLVC